MLPAWCFRQRNLPTIGLACKGTCTSTQSSMQGASRTACGRIRLVDTASLCMHVSTKSVLQQFAQLMMAWQEISPMLLDLMAAAGETHQIRCT